MRSEQIYKKYSELFKYYDYNYERYNVGFSIALLKLNEKLLGLDIDFNSAVRQSDKYLKIDEMYHFFLILGTDINTAFQAILNLEKNILAKYNLYHMSNIFHCAIVSKEKDRNIKEMTRICFELIEDCDENQTIITEDDL